MPIDFQNLLSRRTLEVRWSARPCCPSSYLMPSPTALWSCCRDSSGSCASLCLSGSATDLPGILTTWSGSSAWWVGYAGLQQSPGMCYHKLGQL